MYGTAIQCLRQASLELGLPSPQEAAASREAQAQQMLALLNSAGNELIRDYEWQELRKSATLQLVEGIAEYDLPTDFSKLLNQTLWVEKRIFAVIGPVTPRAWAYLKNSVTLAPQYCFIIQDGQFKFIPVPGSNGMGTGRINFDYFTNHWVRDGTDPNVTRTMILQDTDVMLLDFWLMVKLLKLKTWEAKGLDTTALRDDYMRYLATSTGQDAGAPTLYTSRMAPILPPPYPPNTGFGF